MQHKRLMTGGGLAPIQSHDPVISFIDATNPNLDVEIDCTFDSTAVFQKDCETVKHNTYHSYFSFIFQK